MLLTILPVPVAVADLISIVPASPLIGPPVCKPGFGGIQCLAVPFDTTGDLAFAGNGFAQPAVAVGNIPGFATIHQPEFANDGFYGNGSSWIRTLSPDPVLTDNWLKIDLGRLARIDRITFGRDRNGGPSAFDDRDPGQFTIAVALSENAYANGDDSNDLLEYTPVLDSAALGFGGVIVGGQTVQVLFDTPVLARFVKLSYASSAAAIDEIEIFGRVPEPGTLFLLGPALILLVGLRRLRRARCWRRL